MARFEREPKEYVEKVVYLNRVSKTVKGGRVSKFSALVVVGDEKGKVGYGLGKAAEVAEAIRKGIEDAKKHMVTITLSDNTPQACQQRYRHHCRRPGPCGDGSRRRVRYPRQVPAHQQSPERGGRHHGGA